MSKMSQLHMETLEHYQEQFELLKIENFKLLKALEYAANEIQDFYNAAQVKGSGVTAIISVGQFMRLEQIRVAIAKARGQA